MAKTKKNPPQKIEGKSGRPTKLDFTIVRKVIEVLQIDGTIEEACAYAGISRDTYYNRIKEKAEFSDKIIINQNDGSLITKEVALNFADEVAKAQSFPMILARQMLFKSVKNGDSDKALKFLEKRDKRYQPSMKIGGDKENPVNIVSKQFFLPDNGRGKKKKKKSDPKSDFN